jgi:hypothetical protein
MIQAEPGAENRLRGHTSPGVSKEIMAVVDGNMSQAGLNVGGGSAPPPARPSGTGGGGPERDRARLMLAIYNVRATGAVSLEYLQRRTGFSRRTLWRAFEDLEEVGYVEVLDGDPRGPVVRWMDRRRSVTAQVFASTFLELTEAGRHGSELAALVAEQDTARGRKGSGATRARAVGVGAD